MKHLQKQDYWQKHISAWQSSSQSQKAYCQTNRIALATFCYWKRKLSGRDLKETTFYPLTVASPNPAKNVMASPANLAVHIDRFKLEIHGDVCPEQLKKVVTALEQLR
ncbi:IS66 family insertion sequence element accessory protein TnpA [Desulfosediminicola sp.]|uniref:IS66 family insertion sequence element accessory protein TnpA n=1 Tax=Desulfosediminicola sp. TaxID=2886825 RepID=UPI003AF243AA